MILRRILELIARIIVGIVFVFSGFVKAIDPLGSAFKFTDYFEAFNIEAVSVISLPLAYLLSAIEFAIGMALLFNLLRKYTSWILISFMIYFTGLTLMIAVTNPVSDCGCFGDAIKISNWATFYKNIVLLALSVFILLNNNRFNNRIYQLRTQRVLWMFFFLFSIGISTVSYHYQPLIDFRPFKIGVNIFEEMVPPVDAETDEYKTTLYYQKNGVVKSFTEDNYPWQDTTWHFVDMKNELVKKGHEPTIDQFIIANERGDDIGLDIISSEDKFIFIMLREPDLNNKLIRKIKLLNEKGSEYGHNVAIVTSMPNSEVEDLKKLLNIRVPFYQADDILLKTIIRADPGIFVLNAGTIVGKFNMRRTNIDDKFKNVASYTLLNQSLVKNRYNVLSLGLIFMVILLVYLNLEKKY